MWKERSHNKRRDLLSFKIDFKNIKNQIVSSVAAATGCVCTSFSFVSMFFRARLFPSNPVHKPWNTLSFYNKLLYFTLLSMMCGFTRINFNKNNNGNNVWSCSWASLWNIQSSRRDSEEDKYFDMDINMNLQKKTSNRSWSFHSFQRIHDTSSSIGSKMLQCNKKVVKRIFQATVVPFDTISNRKQE